MPDEEKVWSMPGVEDVKAEELRAHEPLRWSCGEVVLPGETYPEHVKGCLARKET